VFEVFRARRVVVLLALLLTGCFKNADRDVAHTSPAPLSSPPSLESLSLAERCRLGEQAAFWTLTFGDGRVLEPIPDGDCAKELASADDGRRWLRVDVDSSRDDRVLSTSLFRRGESCSWRKLRLVTEEWETLPASVGAVVLVSFEPDSAQSRAIPFTVGVEPRPQSKDEIATSPCGANPGHLEVNDGRWSVRD
jgi:hypothetical protein